MISIFRDLAKGEASVDFETYKIAMLQMTQGKGISESEIAQFWSAYNLNGRFHFEEQLHQMFGYSQI